MTKSNPDQELSNPRKLPQMSSLQKDIAATRTFAKSLPKEIQSEEDRQRLVEGLADIRDRWRQIMEAGDYEIDDIEEQIEELKNAIEEIKDRQRAFDGEMHDIFHAARLPITRGEVAEQRRVALIMHQLAAMRKIQTDLVEMDEVTDLDIYEATIKLGFFAHVDFGEHRETAVHLSRSISQWLADCLKEVKGGATKVRLPKLTDELIQKLAEGGVM
jgi:archaellum component FlaC